MAIHYERCILIMFLYGLYTHTHKPSPGSVPFLVYRSLAFFPQPFQIIYIITAISSLPTSLPLNIHLLQCIRGFEIIITFHLI